ncbi:hypothetical protein GCM10011519_19280 [Marmoricola endophyticus]|uniref:Threonine/serine exporter family protein n=1 Tax=Marmoricola endophyticus TaxID=2040280 RepID=A0A917BJG3_9ACTN|nr:threonine/serine exporter family protein [Marmoricola endophyticus]GGF45521.1 hypothetical protein GCM10011519_19280 [Marmoricola endophyticus]
MSPQPTDRVPPEEVYATFDLALRIGEVLQSSGAGAGDVAAQMSNVALSCGLRGANADVTFTELAMSYQPRQAEPVLLQVRQVRYRETDYGDLTSVDHLVRDLAEGRIDREEAAQRLNRIVSTGRTRPRWATTAGSGLVGGGLAVLLGGSWLVILLALGTAVGIDVLQRRMARRRLPAFYRQVAGGLFATMVVVGVVALGVDLSPSRLVTSSIIVLLAGVNFLGAIQDALTGYPVTAGARILEALMSTAGVIAGVSGGFQVAGVLGVDLGPVRSEVLGLAPAPISILGGAITAGASAYAAYAPLRSVAPIAVIGGAAIAVYQLALDNALGAPWSAALAALLVGLVAFAVAARVRIPALVVVVTGIIPLLPGLSIYRGLIDLTTGGNGIFSMASAATISIALSSGAILGEYLAQPLRREAHRLENRLAGPRLVGPLSVRAVRRRRKPKQPTAE